VLASDFHLHRRDYTRRPAPSDRSIVAEHVDGVDFQWLWAAAYAGNDWRRLYNWWTFSREVQRAGRQRPRPDIVIGSSPQLLAARAAREVARRHDCPFVFEVRDLWPESLLAAGGKTGLAYRALDAIANDLYRTASLILVLAEGTADYLREKGIRQPIACVPNGADVQHPPVAVPPDSPTRPCTFVYAGAHGPANGLDTVLDAAAMLGPQSQVRFVFVGDGPVRATLEASALQRGLTHVSFLGPKPKTELPRIFAEADAGLMVLRDAPLFAFAVSPNKLFDYFAAGLPVINNVPGDVAGMVRQAEAGIQAADSTAESLVQAVRAFQQTPGPDRTAMRQRGRQWVERTHGREVLGRRLHDVLTQVR